MPSPAELVAALSRAYALTDVFPAGDPVSMDALGHLRGLLREGAVVEVSPAGLRVDGIDVPDFHGGSGRFARDLRMLGVDELHFSGDLEVDALERFVRVLREDALQGGAGLLRPATHGSGIDVLFQGEVAAPGEETEVIPFPRIPQESWGPEDEAPGEDPGRKDAEGAGEADSRPQDRPGKDPGRPGRALVASIAELFDAPALPPATGSPPADAAADLLPPGGPPQQTPAAAASAPADARPADLGAPGEPLPGEATEPDPRLVADIEALLGREFPDEDVADRMHLDGTPEPPAPTPPLEPDPHFGWAPDPDAGYAGQGTPGEALDPSSLDDFGPPVLESGRPPRSFSFPPKRGGRGGAPAGDPDWDPFDAREAMTRARSGEREAPSDPPGSPVPPPRTAGGDPAAALPFASEGVVGDVSFGRKLEAGGNETDSPSSVRDASFADPETMGEAHFGRSDPRSTSRENRPFLDWPGPGGEAPVVRPAPVSGPPPAPARDDRGDPFDDILGLAGQGESSHALFFFDEETQASGGAEFLGEDLLAPAAPPEADEPPVDETEVEPPAGEWDRALDAPATEEVRAGADSGEGEPDGDEVVPLWHLEPEVPIWDRQEEGSVEPGRQEEGESLDTLVHRVLIGFGEQRRRAMDELRARAAPTLNPLVLDEFVNAVLDLLRADESGTGLRDLARDLTTHGVASRLVARLGQERDAAARRELAVLFGRIGESMSRALVDALVDEPDRATRRIYLEALASMGPEGVGAVHRMLNDARWFVVRNGLALLGDMGEPASVSRILPVLAHPDARVRREAVSALSRLGGDDIPRVLEQRLGDPAAEVRTAAAAGLGARKVESAAPALLALLDSEKDPVALEAVMGALGDLGEPSAVPPLERRASGSLLSRPPTQIRVAAYRALHAIGTPHARGVVQAAAGDRDPEVRAAVAALQGGGGGRS